MRNFILIMALSSFSILSAQDLGGESLRVGSDGYTVVTKKDGIEKTQGSPYFNDEFLASEVINYNQPISLRYNAATDDMEFEQNNQLYSLQKEIYSTVYLGPQKIKYTYLDFKNGSKSQKGFLSVIGEKNNIVIYKKESIKLIPPKVASSSYEKSSPATYKKQSPEFYIGMNGQIVNIPTNKKKFARLFGDDEKRVLEIVDSNKINLENEGSLKHFINKL